MPDLLPVTLASAGPAGPILEDMKKQMGSVPNIFATLAHSPAVLEGFLAFSGSLGSGVLDARIREQIALAVAGKNGCDYCASAHTVLAAGVGIAQDEAANNLRGKASDPKTQAILNFALSVVAQRGKTSPEQLTQLRDADVSDAEIVEILANVAINLFTNYFNHVARTEIDFPFVAAQPSEYR